MRRDSRRAELDTEAAAAVTAIAGLRRRLNRPGVLENPAVRSELFKLDEQLSAQFSEQGEGNPGRHRSVQTRAYGRPRSRQIADASGFDLKPDPLSASTPAEFVEVLRRYKVWSGDPSWRKIEAGMSVGTSGTFLPAPVATLRLVPGG
jgi:hypothetical protein